MRTSKENGKMIVYLEGSINSENASKTEEEIMSVLKDMAPDSEIAFDAKKLSYISSAGLRILLKVRKKFEKAITIFDVNQDIYYIFEDTGFINIMNVKKALRSISLDGCEKIYSGSHSDFYRLNSETTVKVYKGEYNSPEKIEQNRLIAKTVFTHGIPSVIPFDMVKAGDSYGLVYEMMCEGTLASHLSSNPQDVTKYGKMIAELAKKLHSTEIESSVLQDARIPYLSNLKFIKEKGYFTTDEESDLYSLIMSIPERNTFIHRDLHPGNIMLMDDEPILIDVDDSGVGHPLLDLIGMYKVHNEASKTGWTKRAMGLGEDVLVPLWNTIIESYLGNEYSDKIPEVNRVLKGYGMLNSILGLAATSSIPEDVKVERITRMKKALFSVIDTLYPIP